MNSAATNAATASAASTAKISWNSPISGAPPSSLRIAPSIPAPTMLPR
jgi:hypothetical protein